MQIVLYKSFETYLKVSLTSSLHYVVFKVRHRLFGGAFDIICARPPVVNIFFKIFKEKIEPSESAENLRKSSVKRVDYSSEKRLSVTVFPDA